jgi:hypothetical protein
MSNMRVDGSLQKKNTTTNQHAHIPHIGKAEYVVAPLEVCLSSIPIICHWITVSRPYFYRIR